MYISIDTEKAVSELDASILALLAGLVEEPIETTKPVAAEPAAKKPAAKKPAAKKVEPEPMAEEPVPEEDEAEEDEAEEASDEDLLALAVKKATEMVSGGNAAKVREALDAAGASRVRELNKDNVRAFFKALS